MKCMDILAKVRVLYLSSLTRLQKTWKTVWIYSWQVNFDCIVFLKSLFHFAYLSWYLVGVLFVPLLLYGRNVVSVSSWSRKLRSRLHPRRIARLVEWLLVTVCAGAACSLSVLSQWWQHAGGSEARSWDDHQAGSWRTLCHCAQWRQSWSLWHPAEKVSRDSHDERWCQRLRYLHWLTWRSSSEVVLKIFVCYYVIVNTSFFPFSAFTLLVGQQEWHPACKKTQCLGTGMVICLEQGAYDLRKIQLVPLPPHHLLLYPFCV